MPPTRVLSDAQLSQFDRDLMEPHAKQVFFDFLHESGLDARNPLRVLDVGGGNGLFADLLLAHLPQAHVTVLDNSDYLLNHNRPDSRKTLVLGSAVELERLLPTEAFDLITFNWVLHHLVGRTRRQTMDAIEQTLRGATHCLAAGGRVSVFENVLSGRLWHSWPNRVIFAATRHHWPLLTPLLRRKVFNTAGTGVFFMSDKMLRSFFAKTGLRVEHARVSDAWIKTRAFRALLSVRAIEVTDYWMIKA